MTSLDVELAHEAAHLTTSRAALTAMRTRTEELTRSDVAGDPFSAEMLARALARRLEQLLDDGTTPLFFGRLDFGGSGTPYAGETFHVGRRHVTDAAGDPLVVDWRAPVSTAFYQASALAPQGVRRRRRFGFAGGRLTSFEDEHLDSGEEAGLGSRLLTEEIERPRVGPMRDIVATIQPDQDALVRADLDTSLCIQGAPGTGKTAVGLHRAAYLLYAYRERLSRTGVLVVGPNAAFLRYIAEVLPALGEVDVLQRTITQLVDRVPVRAVDTPEALAVKGDARMAAVLAASLTSALRAPSEPLVYTETGARLRLGPSELGEITAEARASYAAGTPYSTARDRVAHRVAERFRRQVERRGGSPSDAWVTRVVRSRTMRTWLDAVWPPADPVALVARVLGDADLLARAADGILTPAEQDAIVWPEPRRRPRWTEADAVLIDEAAGLLERTPGFGHVIVDEAQDLSPMQARAIARRSPYGSLTVLGDLAQGTAANGARDWPSLLTHLDKPATVVTPLTTGYRMPAEIVEFANRLLPALAAGVAPARSVRRAPGALSVEQVRNPVTAAVALVRAAVAEPGSVALICADATTARIFRALTTAGLAAIRADQPPEESPADATPGTAGSVGAAAPVTVLPATLAKGLEFDTVVVLEPAAIVAAEPRGLNRLYVVLTRAVSRLVVVHAQNLPAELR